MFRGRIDLELFSDFAVGQGAAEIRVNQRENSMHLKHGLKAAAVAAGLVAFAGGAQAKTFVYCSEGSPEGFDPDV